MENNAAAAARGPHDKLTFRSENLAKWGDNRNAQGNPLRGCPVFLNDLCHQRSLLRTVGHYRHGRSVVRHLTRKSFSRDRPGVHPHIERFMEWTVRATSFVCSIQPAAGHRRTGETRTIDGSNGSRASRSATKTPKVNVLPALNTPPVPDA